MLLNSAKARDVRDAGLIPGLEDPLEKGMATYSSILAWKIPWTEEPGGLQSMGSQKTWTQLSTLAYIQGWKSQSHCSLFFICKMVNKSTSLSLHHWDALFSYETVESLSLFRNLMHLIILVEEEVTFWLLVLELRWWKWKLLSRVHLSSTPWTIQPMGFSRPEYWSG